MRARTWTTIAATSVVVAGLTGVALLAAVRGVGSAPTTGPMPAAATAQAVAAAPPVPPSPATATAGTAPPVARPPLITPPLITPPPVTPPAVTPRPRTVAGLPCALPADGDGACVSVSRRHAWLVRDGVVAMSVPVQTGKKGATTPIGHFSVLYKDADHHSREFDDAPMPYSVFFYPGDAFHTGSLSQRSNGCVHLGNSSARAFFSGLHVGDPVQVVP